MRNTYSQEQLEILSALQGVAQTHTMGISKKELTNLLLWVRLNYPYSETRLLFEIGFWQKINRHLYLLATRKDEVAMKLLAPARIMLEATSANIRRSAGQRLAAGPVEAGVEEQSSKKRLALVPISPRELVLGESGRGVIASSPSTLNTKETPKMP